MSSKDMRLEALKRWLAEDVGIRDTDVSMVSGDASFRRYFRVVHNNKPFIVMDAPPEHEDCGPFILVAEAMAGFGLNVPEIVEVNIAEGFLLLSDLGDRQYLDELNDASADQLYGDAINALLLLQTKGSTSNAPIDPYNHATLMREMSLLQEWFLERLLSVHLGGAEQEVLNEALVYLAQNALAQPTVWVHRDYHSRNLMVTDNNNPGMLDFQDALVGPVSYDLVSLLRDCYITWPHERLLTWARNYFDKATAAGLLDVDFAQFMIWFDLMGLQRHLKVLGIFSRLNLRDHKPEYMADIPRVMGYVLDVANRHDALAPLAQLFETRVVPAMEASGYVEASTPSM